MTAKALTSQQKRTKSLIMAKSGLSARTVQKHLHALHGQQEAYISHWLRAAAQGQPSPVYAIGTGEDAPKPAPMLAPKEGGRSNCNEARNLRRRNARLMALRPVADCMLPRALAGQRAAFPLAGVWA